MIITVVKANFFIRHHLTWDSLTIPCLVLPCRAAFGVFCNSLTVPLSFMNETKELPSCPLSYPGTRTVVKGFQALELQGLETKEPVRQFGV